MQLAAVMIYAKNLPLMAAFYGETLGLSSVPETRTDTWAEFAAGGVRLALHAIPPHLAADIEILTPPQPREETPFKLIFAVHDPPSEQRRLEALGVTILPRPWTGFDALDPEGNIFHIGAGK
jgi:catechol 2,3-dioxygenase-like lactoylglutathione lyase family enzyme